MLLSKTTSVGNGELFGTPHSANSQADCWITPPVATPRTKVKTSADVLKTVRMARTPKTLRTGTDKCVFKGPLIARLKDKYGALEYTRMTEIKG